MTPQSNGRHPYDFSGLIISQIHGTTLQKPSSSRNSSFIMLKKKIPSKITIPQVLAGIFISLPIPSLALSQISQGNTTYYVNSTPPN
jgi:hypothetical protein